MNITVKPSPEFAPALRSKRKEAAILADIPLNAPTKCQEGLPDYLAFLYTKPLLTKPQEQHLFRKFNYLKYKASHRPAEVERLLAEALAVRTLLIECNLRLVYGYAKSYAKAHLDREDAISADNTRLIRAVDGFDYTLGYKFSTYASWAIFRVLADLRRDDKKHDRDQQEDHMEYMHDHRSVESYELAIINDAKAQAHRLLGRLSASERDLIEKRFGIKGETQTLKTIGAALGLTRARVGQLEKQALGRMAA